MENDRVKILLCSMGSRGDIQPFLILGEYLSAHGHDVTVCSAQLFSDLAKDYDVKYEFFEGDYGLLIDDEQMKNAIGKNPFTIRKQLKEKVYPLIQSSLEKFYELSLDADLVIYHPKTMIDSFVSTSNFTAIKAYVVPAFSVTKEFRNPILAFLPLPGWMNALTYRFSNAMAGSIKYPVQEFRKAKGLDLKKPLLAETPVMYGISPLFLKRPVDYPDNHVFTGFWFRNIDQEFKDPTLESFLGGDKKILVITFGSMPYKSHTPIQEFIDNILEKFDVKILIVRAWGLKDASIREDEKVMTIDRAPFDWLFPKVYAVMHHGGAGTTATALRAGVPQFICPILHPFGDQYFWGKQVFKKELGPHPVPLKKLKKQNLLASIEALFSFEMKTNAENMSKKLQKEDGLANAMKWVLEL